MAEDVADDFPLTPSFVLETAESEAAAQFAFDRIIARVEGRFGFVKVDNAIAEFDFGTVYGAENEFEEFGVVFDISLDDAGEDDFEQFAEFIDALRPERKPTDLDLLRDLLAAHDSLMALADNRIAAMRKQMPFKEWEPRPDARIEAARLRVERAPA